MSWWQTGAERVWIGDSPADDVTDGLKKIALERTQSDQPKPTLPQLLATLAAVLQRDDPRLSSLTALSKGGNIVAGSRDRDLESKLEGVVHRVKASYNDDLKREPTIKEILACFLFVLGDKSDDYLSDAEGTVLKDIREEFTA